MSEDRLRRIEESAAFADQRADALDEAMRDLGDRLEMLMRRIARIEARLGDLESSGEDDAGDAVDPAAERPPHSGRLPGDR
ncbi:MAG: SlyX family protein [Phycisphaerales bacterium]